METTIKAYKQEIKDTVKQDLESFEYCSIHSQIDKAQKINLFECSELLEKGYEPFISIIKGNAEGQLIMVQLRRQTLIGSETLPIAFIKTFEMGNNLFNQFDYMESLASNLFVEYCEAQGVNFV